MCSYTSFLLNLFKFCIIENNRRMRDCHKLKDFLTILFTYLENIDLHNYVNVIMANKIKTKTNLVC